MKWLKIIVIGLYFDFFYGQLCETLIQQSTTEGNLRNLLEKEFSNIKNQTTFCIESLVLTGNYKALETYTTMLNDNGIKYRETLFNAISSIKFELEKYDDAKDLKNVIIEDKKVTPVFRWAQSMERIFIQVKFSYRFDYPSCENINSLITHIDDSSIAITGKCVLSDIPVIFSLNLVLLKFIDKENSLFINDQNGFRFDLKKKEKDYWLNLMSPDKKSEYPQMSIWYEIKSKYESELKEYEKKEEEKSYEEIELELKQQMKEERKKARKKKGRKKKVMTSDL